MCGIVASVDWTPGRLAGLMELAAQRGPHGWGVYSRAGRYVQLGKFVAARDAIERPAGPIIGHTRLATSGTSTNVLELQPLAFKDDIGPFAIAHNGTIPNLNPWKAEDGLECATANDSEIIGRWLANINRPMGDRLRRLPAYLHRPYALAVWTPTGVWVMRRYHPVFTDGRSACSRPFHDGRLIPEDEPLFMEAT